MKKIGLLFFVLSVSLACFAQSQPILFKTSNSQQMNAWVDSIFKTMTLDEKVGQLFMVVAAPDASYHNKVSKYIEDQKIGGVLFSGGKLNDQATSINLYQKKSRIPLLISFDGEWGLAMRLKEDTPLFPHNMMLGAIQDNELLRLYGEEVGRECRELGVHINFAPVLDVNNNPDNPVIGVRSFGEKPQPVAEKGLAYSSGLESQKVLAVAKHFPGHGDTKDDSHHTLPRINHPKSHLEEFELYPFAQYIDAGFSGVMTGHLSIPALDNTTGLPTSLSPKIVTDLLINQMGFRGLTFTDALVMKGAASGKYSVCVQALLAGNDVLLSPEKPATEFAEVKKAVQKGIISEKLIEEKCRKILQYKYIVGLKNYTPIQMTGLQKRINSNYSGWLIQRLNNEAITLLKNEEEAIPLKGLANKKIAVLSIGSADRTTFQNHFSLYGGFDYFQISISQLQSGAVTVFNQLKKYDTIICGIHSNKVPASAELQSLIKEKKVHVCFFISPYSLPQYRLTIMNSNSVTLAYENTDPAQKAAAEVIMGGIPARGKLPVTVADIFECGQGLETQKVRLSYQEPYEKKLSTEVLDSIELIVKEGIAKKAFPGCQILIAKEGVVVYNKAFGNFTYTGNRKVLTLDIYDLASVTKALGTLPAVMKLYDQRKLQLSSKVGQFVPELKRTDKDLITLEKLLFHESRLPAFLPFYELLIDKNSYSGRLYSNRRSEIYSIHYDTDTYMRPDFRFNPEKVSKQPKAGFETKVAEDFYVRNTFHKEVLNEIANVSLRSRSGYLYSDLNFILLKEIVENISEEKLDDYLDQNFFANLGANNTHFMPLGKIERENIVPTENDNFLRKQLLVGYPHDEAAAVMGGVSGHAGLFSNANDMAKMLQMLLNGGIYGGEQYLSKNTVQLFTRTKSKLSRRGLGFDKPDPSPGKGSCSEETPLSTYGHTGFTGTCFWVDPENQLIYIFLSNRVHPSRTHKNLMSLKIRPRIQSLIYGSMQKT